MIETPKGSFAGQEFDLPLMYCADCLRPITEKGWTCDDSCPRHKEWERLAIVARISE